MGGLHSKAGLLADGWAQIPWSLIRVNIKTYSRALFVPLKTTPLTGHTNAFFKESPFLNVYFFLNFGDRWLDGYTEKPTEPTNHLLSNSKTYSFVESFEIFISVV